MRFLHTSDWHLGRLFHGVSLTQEQGFLLDQLCDLAVKKQADALLLAGDLYDRTVPPADAVRLFDAFLNRMASARIPVIAITGNHDSGDRLNFGAKLMRERGIHLCARIEHAEALLEQTVVLHDMHGPVHIYSLPYMEPEVVRHLLDDPALRDPSSCMRALLENLRAAHPKNTRSVLLAHAFVGRDVNSVEESESERPLSIGGSALIEASVFEGFDYVALGHLHRPQRAGSDTVQYAGSLYPYSFSEANHAKSVNLVEMNASGDCHIQKLALTPRRQLRIVEGLLDDILSEAHTNPRGDHDDFLLVRLLDRGALLHPMARLRDVFPNVLQIERTVLEREVSGELAFSRERAKNPTELFADFFEQVTGSALDEAEREAYAKVADSLSQRERNMLCGPGES